MPSPTRLPVVALFVTAFLPLTAAAGPMGWTYTSSFHALGQPGVPAVYLGAGGTGPDSTYYLTAALTGLSESGQPSNPGADGRVSIGQFSLAQYSAYNKLPTVNQTFELDVTITDTASGATGTAVFTGFGNTQLSNGPVSPYYSLAMFFYDTATQTLRLGGEKYVVTIPELPLAGWNVGPTGNVMATVTVTPDSAPVTTPEPGTLVLVGAGLLGVAGVRRLRR